MPHLTTWSRLLQTALDPHLLAQAIPLLFASSPSQPSPRATCHICLDGKTLRGTIPAGQSQSVHLLAAYAPAQGLVLAQVEVTRKENELSAAPLMVRQLDLRGRIVSGDAMFTQAALSSAICAQGGDYLWALKANQPSLLAAVTTLFAPPVSVAGTSPVPTDFVSAQQVSKGHGRLEERHITVSSLLAGYSEWPHLAQAFRLESRVTVMRSGKRLEMVRSGITSAPREVLGADKVLGVVREHWSIENGLHYRRDASLGEDRSLVRSGQAPAVLAALNNLVVGLYAHWRLPNMAAGQRALSYALERALA